MCDLIKEFDTIKHETLIQKLNEYGVREVANKIMKLYLGIDASSSSGRTKGLSKKSSNLAYPKYQFWGVNFVFIIYVDNFFCSISQEVLHICLLRTIILIIIPGFYIDGRLTWSIHADETFYKLSTALYSVRRIKSVFMCQCARLTYYANFNSVATYTLIL